jgi:hypothetical protein
MLILKGLRVAGVKKIAIFCYGMKCPTAAFEKFDNIMTTVVHQQIDIGTNVDCSTIPLFNTTTGSIFEMCFKAGAAFGSLNVRLLHDQHEGRKVTASICPQLCMHVTIQNDKQQILKDNTVLMLFHHFKEFLKNSLYFYICSK